ncbi:MAG: tRNA (guanosine(46)-N7)-methyltransferase TrmB, partial [Azospira sp.]|nr:tRNA (guanosine(46)-N7)-methyltransferase TrmB [Azospira sp.]
MRSFVLRQGRVSNAQQRYYDEMMPKIGIPYTAAPLDLDAVFGRAAPKILEIGCGMGETTAAIAAAHPENDYLGLEVHAPGVGSLCKLIAEGNIANLR